MSTSIYKRLTASLLTSMMLVSIIYPLTLPKKAEAQAKQIAIAGGVIAALAIVTAVSTPLSVPSESKSQNVKETVSDGIVNMLIAAAISTVITSMTRWVNSGFQNKPSFIQNYKQATKDVGDRVFSEVLADIEQSDMRTKGLSTFICGPFSQEIHDAFRIRIAAAKGGSFTQHSACTIDGVLAEAGQTLEAFEDDFTQGGWPAWLELTTNPVNNRYGAYFIINNEVGKRIAEAVDDQNKQLAFGSGFLSQKVQGECLDTAEEQAAYAANSPLDGSPHFDTFPSTVDRSVAQPDPTVCYKRGPDKIVTPGQVISTQMNKVLGSGHENLVKADEVDELVAALLSQLLNSALQGIGGLFGSSNPEPGQTSVMDELGEEADRLNEEAEQKKAEADAAAARAAADAAAAKAKAEEIEKKAKELEACLIDLAQLKEGHTILVPNDDGTYREEYSNPAAIARRQAKCDKIKADLDILIGEATEEGGAYCPFGFHDSSTDEKGPKGERIQINDDGFTATEAKPNLRINLPAKVKGKSYDHITVDLDVKMGQWNSECAASFGGRCYHAIFWSLRGDKRWCWDQMADVVLVGPSEQKLKLTSKIGGDEKADAGGNFSGSFHVHYEFNGNAMGGGTARVTLTGNNVSKTATIKNTVPFINFGGGAFFEFGQEGNPEGPEAAPIGWKFNKIEIVLENSAP